MTPRAMRKKAFGVRFKAAVREFAFDCSAAAVVEYAFLILFLALVVFVALSKLSGQFNDIYARISAAITG